LLASVTHPRSVKTYSAKPDLQVSWSSPVAAGPGAGPQPSHRLVPAFLPACVAPRGLTRSLFLVSLPWTLTRWLAGRDEILVHTKGMDRARLTAYMNDVAVFEKAVAQLKKVRTSSPGPSPTTRCIRSDHRSWGHLGSSLFGSLSGFAFTL
jgi:hypothetical protein